MFYRLDPVKSLLLSIQTCLTEEWPLKPYLITLVSQLIKETTELATGLSALCLFIHDLVSEHSDLIIQLLAHILRIVSIESTESPKLSLAFIFILKKACATQRLEYLE
jgi:hypothetical protein